MQKYRSGLMFSAIIMAAMLGTGIPASIDSFDSQAVAAGEVGSASCLNALIAAQQRIREGRSLQVRSDLSNLSNAYPDHPVARPHKVSFIFSGQSARDVMASDLLQTSISTSVVTHCDSVGMVLFGVDRTGSTNSWGWMSDGSVKVFDCVEPGRGTAPLVWGQQYCGVWNCSWEAGE
jgi:hypothetical protein